MSKKIKYFVKQVCARIFCIASLYISYNLLLEVIKANDFVAYLKLRMLVFILFPNSIRRIVTDALFHLNYI